MARPQTEGEYLATLRTAPVSGLSRRSLLLGTMSLGSMALVGCGGNGSGNGTGAGEVTYGNNQADEVPLKAIQANVDAFQQKHPDIKIKMNTVAHTTFQENINNYLQGSPDDVFAWFAGYRARFFADKGLVSDISDVFAATEGIPASLKNACSTADGRQVVMPATYYPWVVQYRKSVWEKRGYEVPKTLDELKALGAEMEKDGLVPFAMADKDGWEAMGLFDILNMRLNGYPFHIELMSGKQDWSQKKVQDVFDLWRGLLPLHQPDALGRSWQEAARSLQKGTTGMYYLGTFMAQQFPAGKEQEDLDFFVFPEIDSTIGAGAIEAPTDGFMLSRRPKNEKGAKTFLSYMGSAEAQMTNVQADPSAIAVNEKADTTKYTSLQKRMLEVMKGATDVAQFLDRDSRPDFASTVMGPALQSFLKNPNDVASMLSKVESQRKSIFAS